MLADFRQGTGTLPELYGCWSSRQPEERPKAHSRPQFTWPLTVKIRKAGFATGFSYIPEWRLTLDGLASGLSVSLNIRTLLASVQVHEQITRLVCVEVANDAGFGPGESKPTFKKPRRFVPYSR